MFRRIDNDPADEVAITVDGVHVKGRSGDSVAGVLLAAGRISTRKSAVSGAPRGPYCMMGSCFECLVRIDGVSNRQGCLTPIAEGMRVETQAANGGDHR